MAKKKGSSGDSVGTASVDVVANLEPLIEQLAEVPQMVQAAVAEGSGKGRKGGRAAGGARDVQQVDADLKIKQVKLNTRDVQSTLDNTEAILKVELDTVHLRKQIENFLQQEFKIKLGVENISAERVAGVGAHPGPAVAVGAPAGRGAIPEDISKAMTPVLRDAVDNIYRNVKEAFAVAGKSFGTQSSAAGNQVEKALELVDQFGGKVSDMLTLGPGGIKTTGGSMSPASMAKMLGIDKNAPELKALDANARGLMSSQEGGRTSTRSADILFTRLAKWAQTTPLQAQPAAAQESVMPAAQQRVDAAAATRIEAESRAIGKAVQEAGQKKLGFTTLNPADIGSFFAAGRYAPGPRTSPGGGTPGTFDPEAEAKARQALGADRANTRRLRGSAGAIGGIQLEPFLRAAESGLFHNVFERFEGGVSQGLQKGSASDISSFDELSRLGRRQPGRKFNVQGQSGQFAAVRPFDALVRTIIEATGNPDATQSFIDQPKVTEAMRKAVQQGSRPRAGASGETKRGQASARSLGGANDLGREAQRFYDFIDYLDGQIVVQTGLLKGVNESLAAARASGQREEGIDVQGLQAQAKGFRSSISGLQRKRAETKRELEIFTTPVDAGSREANLARSARHQKALEGGLGLDEAERIKKSYFDPTKIGARSREILGDTSFIQNALQQQFLANPNRVGDRGRGEVLTGPQALAATAFGPSRRPGRGRGAQGVYGQILGTLPDELTGSPRREVEQAVRDVLQDLVGNERFLADLTEGDLKRKEQMATVRPGTTKATIAHGLTGEGQYRFGPGQRAALESDIAKNERYESRAPRLERFSGALRPAAQRILAVEQEDYTDPQTLRAQLEASEARRINEAAEGEKRVTTRQKTMGRGRYTTGDTSVAAARAMGLTMPAIETPERETLAQYAARYGGGPGGGGGGGAGGGGAGGGEKWPVEITGPIHVIVDNVPLRVAFEGGAPRGGGGGRGRPEPDVYSASPDEPESAPPQYAGAARKPSAVERAMERDLVASLRAQNDPRTGQRFDARTYARESGLAAGQGQTPAEKDFLRALQGASTESGQAAQERRARQTEAEVKRQRRVARVSDPVGFAAERDIADTSLADIRGQNRALQRRVPRRGFGASVTDLITSIIGGGALENQLESADRAQREVNEINQAAEKRSGIVTQRRGLLQQARALPRGDERRLGILEQARELGLAARQQTQIIKESTRIFGENSKVVKDNTAAAFAAAAVGSIGSVGIGALTFGLGSAIAAPVIQAVSQGLSEAIGPLVERLTGFQGTSARITGAAADEFRGRGGDVGAISGFAARTGIGADEFARIGGGITSAAQIEAGNKALQDQIDLLHTAEQLRSQGGGAQRGLTATTGGFLGTPLFGIPSTQELLNKELAGIATPDERPAVAAGNAPLDVPSIGGISLPGFAPGDSGLGMVTKTLTEFDKQLKDGTERLDFFNAAAKKGGSTLELVSGNASEVARSVQQARDAGLFDLANTLDKERLTVRGAGSGTDVQSFLAAINRGATTPDPRLLLEDTSRQRRAQIQFEDQQRQFALQTTIPQSSAIALAGQGFGTGGPQTARTGINTTGLSTKEQAQFNKELGVTQSLYDQINREVDMGVKNAKAFVAQTFAYDPQVGKDFAQSLERANYFGQKIAAIQIDVQTKQAAYQAKQFTVQIELTKRALADAKGLVSGIGNNLGAVERQMYNLNRQSQALSLGMTQRQINFQRALAGFQVPGLTPEEQAARVEQSKLEADYAQKQLDIQKKLFGLGGKQFDIQAARQVQDLARNLDLLQQGRTITIETAAADKKIRALTILQEKENKKVQTYYEAAIQRTNDIMGEEAKLVAATGKALTEITTDVINAFIKTYRSITAALSGNLPGTQNTGGGGMGGSALGSLQMGDYTHAEGWIGSVQGKTSFGKYGVAGEAGGEAVAILRDPKQLMSPMGGGGAQHVIQIVVQGNKFSTVEEQDAMVRKIQEGVERGLARRGSALGLA